MNWVDILQFIILLIFIAPVSLLFHEIGHAIAAKWMNATSIQLNIGAGKQIWTGSIKNIQVRIRKMFLFNFLTSTIRKQPFLKNEKIFISMMGPSFNAFIAIVAYLLYNVFTPLYSIYLFFLFNVWFVFINLVPFKIGQKQSDGYTICKLLLNNAKG